MPKIIRNGVQYGGGVYVDDVLSTTSINPIMNKAVATAINQINNDLTASDNLKFEFSYDQATGKHGYLDTQGTFVPFKKVQGAKTVSPSTSQQTVTPDSGYDGLESVTVFPIQAGSVTPSSSGTSFSSGLKNMTSSGYAYSSRPSSGYSYGWDSETTLWTNSSPSSNFTTQTITLSNGISNYRYIRIEWRGNKDYSSYTSSIIIPVSDLQSSGSASYYPQITLGSRNVQNNSGRYIRYTSDTQLYLHSAYIIGSSDAAANTCIPLEIVGLR